MSEISLPPEHKSTIVAYIEGQDVDPDALKACAEWWADAHSEDSYLVSHFRARTDPDASESPDTGRFSVYYSVAELHPAALPEPLPDEAQENVIAARFKKAQLSDYGPFSLSTQNDQAAITTTVDDDHFGQLHTGWLLHEIFEDSEDWEKIYALYRRDRDLPAWVGDTTTPETVTFERGQGFPKINVEFDDDRDHVLLLSLAHVHTTAGRLLYENEDVKRNMDVPLFAES